MRINIVQKKFLIRNYLIYYLILLRDFTRASSLAMPLIAKKAKTKHINGKAEVISRNHLASSFA